MKFRMSKSKMYLYRKCPRKFYIETYTIYGKDRVSNEAAKKGSTLHELFELYNKNSPEFDYYEQFLMKDDFYKTHIGNFFIILSMFGLDRATYAERKLYDEEKNLVGIIEGTVVPKSYIGDAGYDLHADIPEPITIRKGDLPITISTGLALAMERNVFGLILPRSGLTKAGVNAGIGVVDSGYTGRLMVTLSTTQDSYVINPKDRIAQLVFLPLVSVSFVYL